MVKPTRGDKKCSISWCRKRPYLEGLCEGHHSNYQHLADFKVVDSIEDYLSMQNEEEQ